MDLWDADADYSVQSKYFSGRVYQIAVDETGDRLLQDGYTLDPQLRVLTAVAPPLASTQFRLLVDAEKLHSSGALAYMPTTAGVEIYDVHHGDRLLAIGSSSPMATGPDNLAVNHAGNRLYLFESAGIGVVDLPSAPLSIGSLTPAYGSAAGGDSVVVRGSGFQAGTSVKIDGHPASVQFVDSTQLIVTTPAMTAANNIVSVANPDGTTYSLDAAFDATARALPAPPVLTSLVPLTALVDAGAGNVIITGTGFTASSVVYVNGAAVETLYGSSTEVTGVPLNYPTVGQQTVTVVNPPNPTPSNPLYITTHSEATGPFGVVPSRIAAGSTDFWIRANGNYTFEPNTVLLWNGSPLATTYSDANTIYCKVPATLVAAVGTASSAPRRPVIRPHLPLSSQSTLTSPVRIPKPLPYPLVRS